jgi:hypothetical protein
MVAVRASELVSPLRNGTPLVAGERSALVIGGTGKIRTSEPAVFLKVVVVAPAQVQRDGGVQAQRSKTPPGPRSMAAVDDQAADRTRLARRVAAAAGGTWPAGARPRFRSRQPTLS